MSDVTKAFDQFYNDRDAVEKAIIQSTKASWGGSSYSVELLPDGDYRIIPTGSIGNLYVSPGLILQIPTLNEDEYNEEDPELSIFDAAIDELMEQYLDEEERP